MEWLFSYLTNRSAYVLVNSAHSYIFHIASGVPQGSVLGPLLFNIFVNDLYAVISSRKLSFADDLKLFRVISSLADCGALQEDLNILMIWCDNNGMRVNCKKCKLISFTRCNDPVENRYLLGSECLDRVQSICDLGVTIDSKLKFNEHIGIITAKAFSVLGFIRRHTSNLTDIYALKILYCSLVRSILEYASPVWCPFQMTQIFKIDADTKKVLTTCFTRSPVERSK